jgi:hypothetical protein
VLLVLIFPDFSIGLLPGEHVFGLEQPVLITGQTLAEARLKARLLLAFWPVGAAPPSAGAQVSTGESPLLFDNSDSIVLLYRNSPKSPNCEGEIEREKGARESELELKERSEWKADWAD